MSVPILQRYNRFVSEPEDLILTDAWLEVLPKASCKGWNTQEHSWPHQVVLCVLGNPRYCLCVGSGSYK